METRRTDDVHIAPVISEFTRKGCKDDVLRLAKEDLNLGYPKELVALYAEAGWPIDLCRKFSSIMRSNSDEGFLRMLASGEFNPYQMQLLANYYDKGVTVEQLTEVGAKNLIAYDMEQALKLIYQANQEAEAALDQDSPEMKAIQEKITSMIEEIADNKKMYEQVINELSKLDSIKQSSDEVKDSLTEALHQRERDLEELQDRNNKQASECATLREKAERLEQQVKMLESEKADYVKEKKSVLEERDRFYHQSQMLIEEKNQLLADFEEVQKAKEGLEERIGNAESREWPWQEKAKETPSGSSGFAEDVYAVAQGKNGEKRVVQVERDVRRKPEAFRLLAEKILSKRKPKFSIIKQLTGKGLNPAQMEQVKRAIQAGLEDEEVTDIINSGFSAEEMAQAIEIVVADKAYQ